MDSESQVTKDHFEALDEAGKLRISRTPLGTSEIGTLIEAAIDLHSRALEHRKESRWWVPVFVAIVAAISGLARAIVGALIKAS